MHQRAELGLEITSINRFFADPGNSGESASRAANEWHRVQCAPARRGDLRDTHLPRQSRRRAACARRLRSTFCCGGAVSPETPVSLSIVVMSLPGTALSLARLDARQTILRQEISTAASFPGYLSCLIHLPALPYLPNAHCDLVPSPAIIESRPSPQSAKCLCKPSARDYSPSLPSSC